MHKSGLPHTPITSRKWRATVGWLACCLVTVADVAREQLYENKIGEAPRWTRSNLLRTKKRCVGGYGLRECAAQRQKTLAFSFNMSGDRCRLAREQDVERSTYPPMQRWSHSNAKIKFAINTIAPSADNIRANCRKGIKKPPDHSSGLAERNGQLTGCPQSCAVCLSVKDA
jgi:hypothetical protein